MRRLLLLMLGVAALVGGAFLVRAERDASTQRVDVIFDTAKGMVPGQLVKIAGARAGRVSAVHLTADHRARMELRVQDRYAPFHADASCRILPEGPISENYVQCDPGIASRPLPAVGGVPTVPVSQTTAPVSIQDLLNVFAAPTQTRLRLLINELGIATAGRGEDINDVLRRANPTLRQADALLTLVNGQRAALGRSIDQTDAVLGRLAARSGDVRRFVSSAAAVARTTASHRASLAATVRDLPAMLEATRSGLHAIDRATSAGTPLLADLERSGPMLTALTTRLPQFAKTGVPAVRSLSAAATEGRRAIKTTRPLARSLRQLGATTPVVHTLRDLLASARDHGAIENVQRLFYALANLPSLYNGVSHVVTLFAGVPLQCLVPGVEVPGCSHAYNSPGGGRIPLNDPDRAAQVQRILREALAQAEADTRRRAPAAKAHAPSTAAPAASPGPSAAPAPARKVVPAPVQQLLGGIGALLDPTPKAQGEDSVSALLDYLLK